MFVGVYVRVCVCMLLRMFVSYRVFLCKGDCMTVFLFASVRVEKLVCARVCLVVFVCVSVYVFVCVFV